MSRKIRHEQYEVVVNFKTDNILSVTAEFTPTGELFSNNGAELMRINKETVLASLERKSEKHLRCEFEQVIEEGKKWLQIIFIVNFDFLPEFREEVRLEHVEQKDSLKLLSLTNMQAEISEIDKAIESMQTNGSTVHNETSPTFSNNDKKEVWSKAVNEGRYLLRCSGTINNPTGIQSSDKLSLYIVAPGEKESEPISVRTYHQSGYHYPFFMSETFNCKEGDLKVKMLSSVNNASALNLHFVLNRVVEIN